jgi:ABC-type nitrate/sulfonate/bicarbonate transport system substrate-binding protein
MRKVTSLGRAPGKMLFGAVLALSAVSMLAPTRASAADAVKLSVSAIGRPPIFSNTYVDVGETMGFWKAAGVDVNFRWFQRGSDTAKAALTGDVAVGTTSSQAAINLIASGAPVVAITGMNSQDWVIASDDPSVKSCKDLKGKTVTADGINNARYLYLGAVVATCGLKLSDMKLLNLANAALVKAGIAHQVHSGVFHIDELAQVEFKTGKKWRHLAAPPAIKKGLHYLMLIANKKAIASNREGLIRFLEGWIMTQKMMGSHSAADKVAFANVAAKATGDDFHVALSAINDYQAINYWENNDGLDKKQIMSQLDQLVQIGSIKGKKPTFEQIVDKSLYAEALKRVEAKFGKVQ